MKIQPELKEWFIEQVRKEIIQGVKEHNSTNWYKLIPDKADEVPIESYISWYNYPIRYEADHLTSTYPEQIPNWFNSRNCPFIGMEKEKHHLMTQLRDGAISYKMLFPPKR